jgi:T5SS/PEP-CTERM-associated repeat protein
LGLAAVLFVGLAVRATFAKSFEAIVLSDQIDPLETGWIDPFDRVQAPIVDANGNLAFSGKILTDQGQRLDAIWAIRDGELSALAVEGQPAPGTGGKVYNSLDSFPLLGPEGQVSFFGSAIDPDNPNDQSEWINRHFLATGGSVSPAFVPPQPVDGYDGYEEMRIDWVGPDGISSGGQMFGTVNLKGRRDFRPDYVTEAFHGVGTIAGGQAQELAFYRLSPPDDAQQEEATYWRDFGRSIGNQQGDFVFRGSFQQNFFHGVVTEGGLFTSSGSSINTLALTNEREIGNAGDTTIEQDRPFDSLPYVPSGVGINNPGDVVFSAAAAVDENPSGLWLASGGSNPQSLLRAGHQIDAETTIQGLSSPIINDAGEIAFIATLSDDSEAVMKIAPGESPQVIARSTDRLPGDDDDLLLGGFDSIFLNQAGQLVFLSDVETTYGTDVHGALLADVGDGPLRVLIREEGTVQAGPNDLRRISGWQFAGRTSSSTSDTEGSPFNDAGHVVLDASFEDDTRGIVRARAPRLFVWSGGAGTDNWHSFSGGVTNWKDVYEQPRSDNPGGRGTEAVVIDNAHVVLDDQPAEIGTLTASGSLTVKKPLTLRHPYEGRSVIESLTLESDLTVSNSRLRVRDGDGTASLEVGPGASLTIDPEASFVLDGSDKRPVDGEAEDFDQGVMIGRTGTAALRISDGAVVDSGDAGIGLGASADGQVTVTGPDSRWQLNDEDMWVGLAGTGSLQIKAGGQVRDIDDLSLGYGGEADEEGLANAEGSIQVAGMDSKLIVNDDFDLGGAGTGRLTVAAGGEVQSAETVIGGDEGGPGIAHVTGRAPQAPEANPSTWDTGEDTLPIGDWGAGQLTIDAGGVVHSAAVNIAESDEGPGTVLLSGGNSTWHVDGKLRVGEYGQGELTARDQTAPSTWAWMMRPRARWRLKTPTGTRTSKTFSLARPVWAR